LDADIGEGVALAFIDREDDRVFVVDQVDGRIQNAEIGVALIEVEPAQRFFVRADTVLVIDVVARQERQEVRLFRVDDFPQPAVAECLVTFERNIGDLRAVAFLYGEDDIDAAAVQFLHAGGHDRIIAADPAIGLANGFGIGFHRLTGESPARRQLHSLREVRVLDLLVALEQDLVDDRVFRDRHDQRVSGLIDRDVGEKTRGEEALYGLVQIGPVEILARTNAELPADRVSVDTAISPHLDTAHRSGFGRFDHRHLYGGRSSDNKAGGDRYRRNSGP